MKILLAVAVLCSLVPFASAQEVVYVQDGRMVPVHIERAVYQQPVVQRVTYQEPVVTRVVRQESTVQRVNYQQPMELPAPRQARQEMVDIGPEVRQEVGMSRQRRRDSDQDRCLNRRDCDNDWCPPSDRCFDKCCKDLFLQCRCGSWVLKCDGTGVATYQSNSCVRGTSMREYAKDQQFVYYAEDDSDVKWAFSRACCPTNGHSVFKSKQRGNPLDCDWEHFCYAPPNRCEQPRCDQRLRYDFDPYFR